MTSKTPKKSPMTTGRLKICLGWKLLEVEGEGMLPVVGALVFGLLVLAWIAFR